MNIYLIRHGQALTEAEDPERSLSNDGIEEVRKTAQYLEDEGLRTNLIYHSPKKRAEQTALILAEHLRPADGIKKAGGLLPLDEPEPWKERLDGADEDTMVVGHLPNLDRLASLLVSGDKSSESIDLKCAGVICLKRNGAHYTIEWMTSPEMMKACK